MAASPRSSPPLLLATMFSARIGQTAEQPGSREPHNTAVNIYARLVLPLTRKSSVLMVLMLLVQYWNLNLSQDKI